MGAKDRHKGGNKKMLNIIGAIFGTAGYDIHTRELANALNEITECSLSVPLTSDWVRYVNDKELEMIKRQPDNEINLIITSPLLWKMHTQAKRNWAFLVWEGDRIPKSWVEECLNPDIEYIFVPSQHTKDAILKTLMDEWEGKDYKILDKGRDWSKIKIIHHGVDLKKFYPKTQDGVMVARGPHKPQDGRSDSSSRDKFVFLMNKGFRNMEDRGGVQYGIQAYLEEFTNKDNVELIIKINPAYGFDQNIMKNFKFEENSPKITIISENIEYNKLVDLYNRGDVFVSPTRGEAFNIPCLEAMACGLPVITTDFGGQTDYCSMETGWIIGGKLTEVTWDLQYESVSWLTPNIKFLKIRLRQAYENREEVLSKGKKALETTKNFTWISTAKQITKLL